MNVEMCLKVLYGLYVLIVVIVVPGVFYYAVPEEHRVISYWFYNCGSLLGSSLSYTSRGWFKSRVFLDLKTKMT